jgi:hypothetical protein
LALVAADPEGSWHVWRRGSRFCCLIGSH